MERLVALLQRERLLLELLVFKLVQLRQLLLVGESRFLGWAAEEVERAVEAVREAELERALVVREVATDQDPTDEAGLLQALAAESPEPWRSLLEDHRTALLRLAGEVGDNLASARGLCAAGSRTVTDLLDRVDEPSSREPALATYGPQASWQRTAPLPRVERTL